MVVQIDKDTYIHFDVKMAPIYIRVVRLDDCAMMHRKRKIISFERWDMINSEFPWNLFPDIKDYYITRYECLSWARHGVGAISFHHSEIGFVFQDITDL